METRVRSNRRATTRGTAPTKKVSFVRPRSRQKVVALAATPQAVEIDLGATALLVIDMQNDFLHPEGWSASRGMDIAPVRAVLPAIERLTSRVRRAGVPVIWVNWGVRPDHANISASFVARARGAHGPSYGDLAPSGRGRILVRDDWGAATIDELTVDPVDLLVHKHRLSGFWDNELDSILRHRGITTLLFSGINTDRCVFTSLQDANFLGYDCVLVEDACATTSPEFVRDAVLYLVRLTFGVVASSDAIGAAIRNWAPRRSRPAAVRDRARDARPGRSGLVAATRGTR